MTNLKIYWSLVKILLNNKKIPCIPPILQNNKYVTDFKKKAKLFNLFFAKKYSKIDNSSERPLNFLKKIPKKQTSLSLQLLSLMMILQH